jgi:benzoyl-CoA reductase/2-hydroxyglutaryl-CoA dehydratase subunit BcrC/BadD/HgdB
MSTNIPAAGFTSHTVPWEILRAAGFAPILLEADAGPTPLADRFMERDVFGRRIRVIFDRLASGAWEHLGLVAIPRTSEQEHKLYLYLREMSRAHGAAKMPKLFFYNLLQTRSAEAYAYGLDRTRQMASDLGASEAGLRKAIDECNRARAAVRSILALREEGRIEGSTAVSIIREFYTTNRTVFAKNVRQRLEQFAIARPATRPRILIEGIPLDHTALHELIEQHGGYAQAEDCWMGSRAAGERDMPVEGEPVVAIFEKYYYDSASPRVHSFEEADAWFTRQIGRGSVDGVIFYLPLDDVVAGWDYPRRKAFLESRGVPNLLVRESVMPGASASVRDAIAAFIKRLGSR